MSNILRSTFNDMELLHAKTAHRPAVAVCGSARYICPSYRTLNHSHDVSKFFKVSIAVVTLIPNLASSS